MYKKGDKRFSLLNIILTILAIFIIIFIICWLAKKGTNASKYNKVFENNLNTMHETSKEYFADELPTRIGESKILTLGELNAYGLSDKLYYGNVACDENLSYISITKVGENEYQSKTSLVCGDKVNSITEIIESKNENIPEEPTEPEKEDTPVEEPEKENNTCTCNCNCEAQCTVTRKDTKCTTTYEYEYVSYSKKCPSGYSEVNGTCQSTTTDVKDPIKNYTDSKTVITNATENIKKEYVPANVINSESTIIVSAKTKNEKVYTNPSVKNETITNKVAALTKTNKTYSDPIISTNTSCPSDYKKVNGQCVKYADKITVPGKKADATKTYTDWGNPTKVYTVNEKETEYVHELEKKVLIGSRILDDEYIYTYAIYNRKVSYTCASGKLDGTKCIISTASTKCPDGYKDNGTNCIATKTPTTTTTEKCESGYSEDRSSGKLVCYKTTTEKYCANSKAKLDGNYCVTSEVKTSYVCPTGSTTEGTGSSTKCYTTKTTYYCEDKNAILVDNKCYIPSKNTELECPNGTTQEGTGANTKCYKTTVSYTCDDKYATVNGNKCYKTIGSTFSHYSCEDGYSLNNNNKCVKTTNTSASYITVKGNDYKYSTATSLPGYVQTGVKKYITRCN